jgi:hypothetical protein
LQSVPSYRTIVSVELVFPFRASGPSRDLSVLEKEYEPSDVEVSKREVK